MNSCERAGRGKRLEVIEIGVFASRNPDGSFNDSIPLYVEATPEMKAAELKMLDELGRDLARIYNREKLARIAAENGKKKKDE